VQTMLRRSVILTLASTPFLAGAVFSQTTAKARRLGLLSSGAPFSDTSEIADAIFDQYYHTKWNKQLIGDGVAIAALGILARNGDEAALQPTLTTLSIRPTYRATNVSPT
jgi:hypothetical protein